MQLLDDPATPIPDLARMALQMLARQWETQNAQICQLEAEIVRAAKSDAQARRLTEIPGVGPIGASAILAAVPDASLFQSARNFAAWIGLTPRQFGTGGKQRSGSISKQGNRELRRLLILGATACLRHEIARGPRDPWLRAMLARRPFKVVAVALAAKNARIIWAMLISGAGYRASDHSALAQAA
jgi:transposase